MIIALNRVKYRNSRLVVRPSNADKWDFSIKTSTEETNVMCLFPRLMEPPKSGNHYECEVEKQTIFVSSHGNEVRYCSWPFGRIVCVIQKYLCDLFSLPTGIIFHEDHGYRMFECIVRNTIHTSVLSGFPYRITLDMFFGSHPDQVLSINSFDQKINELDEEPEGIHRVENLVIWNIENEIRWYMLGFRGKNGLFEKANVQKSDIDEFLKQWKTKSNDNLETFIAVQKPGVEIEDIGSITEGLEPWDAEHGNVYPFNSIISEHITFKKNVFNCQRRAYYIRRETDGKIATLKLSTHWFMFFVWK